MTVSSADKNILILVANGFDENQLPDMQRALTKIKTPFKIVAPEQGLVNGWQGAGWGHYFSVDVPIGAALGSDFDALVLLGGERGVAKLKTNPHARRIVNHFVEAEKPIAAIGAGVSLLTLSAASAGRTVVAPAEFHVELKAAGMNTEEADQTTDAMILTATGTDIPTWVEAALGLFSQIEELEQVAA